jgi:hypothetical protein
MGGEMNKESWITKFIRMFTKGYRSRLWLKKQAEKSGLVIWVKYGNWCKGSWDNYLQGYYSGNVIKFDDP